MEIAPRQKKSEKVYPKPSVFFQGNLILPKEINPTTKDASNYLDSLFERMKGGSKADLIFDIDGVLAEISMETAANPKTLVEWAEDNKDIIRQFRRRMYSFKTTRKFRLALCTGRGWYYTYRIAKFLFPAETLDYVVTEGSVKIRSLKDRLKKTQDQEVSEQDLLDYAICEGGALTAHKENNVWTLNPAKGINQDDLVNLDKYRRTIIKYAVGEMGGALEPKDIRLTFNPPRGKTGEMFETEIKNYLLTKLTNEHPEDKEIIKGIAENITHTPTTVEIMPAGVNKFKTLWKMAGDNVKFYFGDANTDRGAMEGSDVNVAPSNSEDSIKNYVKGDKTRSFFGILPDKQDLQGVNKSLKTIITYYRLKNIENIRKSKRKI